MITTAELLDRLHAALRGIDAADITKRIPAEQIDAVSDAIIDLEAYARHHQIALSEFSGRLPDRNAATLSIVGAS